MWVTNNSEHNLEDGYDGVRYMFAKGQSIEVPFIVVQHVFGIGQDDKTPFLSRLGWYLRPEDKEPAIDRLNCFSFSSEKPEPIVHDSPVVEANPLPIPKRKGGGVVRLAA